ncbi:MAG TPA: hypothetical protein VG796_10500 [Verrucomicrobiales bacterium]|jgi:hypothetical protein|nr:hypothetical protein [Verrucomicrobiales bacterium]
MADETKPDLNELRTNLEKAQKAWEEAKTATKNAPDERKKEFTDLEANAKAELKEAGRAFKLAVKDVSGPPVLQRFSEANMVGVGAFAVLAFLLLVFAWRTHELGEFLSQLSEIKFARGFVTALIVLTTSLIALLLLFSCIGTNGDTTKESFARGKEILTILVGICGTCLGFYFSSPDNKSATERNEPSGGNTTGASGQGSSGGNGDANKVTPSPAEGKK